MLNARAVLGAAEHNCDKSDTSYAQILAHIDALEAGLTDPKVYVVEEVDKNDVSRVFAAFSTRDGAEGAQSEWIKIIHDLEVQP